MTQSQLLFTGELNIRTGTEFEVNGARYAAARDFSLGYVDWRGASANLFMSDPREPSKMIPCGPVLEGKDIPDSAIELFGNFARRYHTLLHKTELTEAEQKARDNLGIILKAA